MLNRPFKLQNTMIWRKLRVALQMAEFTDPELVKFALLVGMPQGALQAVMTLDMEHTRSSIGKSRNCFYQY